MGNTKKTALASLLLATKTGTIRCNTEDCACFSKVTAPNSRQSITGSFPKENQKGEKKMSRIFIDFRPAEVVNKKETYVAFYVLNPYTNKMTRKRIRCNHVRGKADRLKYARLLCQAVNERLYEGWNPFFDELPNGSVTIREAISRFLSAKEKSARKRTMDSYRSSSDMFLEWLTLHKMDKAYCVTLNRKNLLDYLSWSAARKCLSNKSYNNYCVFLGTLFGFFKEIGLIVDNPAERIPRKKVDNKLRVTIPKADRKAIKDFVDAHIPRFYYIMQMCYRLFIRPNEIVQLRIGDIDFDKGLLKIPATVAKNHGERILAVPKELMDYFNTLSACPATYYIYADRNTYAPGPKKMAPTRIAETWKRMREKLELPASYQFYSLKDTGITEMLEAGVPAKYVKELADHHSLEMTERYTHRSEARKILEWNRLKF